MACLRAHVLGVLACLRTWPVYVLTCLRAWRAYEFACLRAWRIYVLTCLACLCAQVLTCLVCLHLYVRACLLWWNILFSYVFTYLVCFIFQYLNLKILTAKKLCALLTSRKNTFYIIRKIEVRNVTGDVVMWFLRKVVFVWRLQVRWRFHWGKKESVEQLFYFCGEKNCLLQKPVWCNVQYLMCIKACKTVVEQDIRRVAEEFEFPIVNEIRKCFNQIDLDNFVKNSCWDMFN